MSNNYLLQYKNFDELLAEVLMDFKKWASNSMIDGSELIKVAQKINKRLGNKLRREKEVILYVEKGKVRLPLDFYKHTSAAMCFDYEVTSKVRTGAQREYTTTSTVIPCTSLEQDPNVKPCVRMNDCGTALELIETTKYETRKYKQMGKLTVFMSKRLWPDQHPQEFHEHPFGYPEMPSTPYKQYFYEAYIQDKFLYTNFQTGKVYLSYLGDMEDAEGNLIVLDHPMINDYYEYALKQRIIENLMANGEIIPQNLFQLIEARYKAAKVEGESLVNMPDFADMHTAHAINRHAMYNKYYLTFK